MIADFRATARRRLPRFLFDYIDAGSYSELTMHRNQAELAGLDLRQQVLRDVSEIRMGRQLFGQNWALPVGLGPVGLAGLYARRGEVQAAKAAAAKGVPFCLSTVSVCGLREVAAAAPAWYQLYVLKDRGFMREMLAIATEVKAPALLFTVDLPIPAVRYRDDRSGLSGPGARWRRAMQAMAHPGWGWDVGLRGRPHHLGNVASVLGHEGTLSDFIGWVGKNFDPSIRWADLEWIRECWDRPLIIKGVLDPKDARSAADIGADGIVVSNHGGRALDGAPTPVRALPPIVEAVGDRLTILADSGVRSGADVLRLLALGAKGVLLGRAWAYALAANGEAGVSRMLDSLESEIRFSMALTGCRNLDEISRSVLF